MNLGIEERGLGREIRVSAYESSKKRNERTRTHMLVTVSEEDLEQLDDFFNRQNLLFEQSWWHPLLDDDTT